MDKIEKQQVQKQSELDAAKRRIERLQRVAERRRHSAKLQNTLFQISELSASDMPMLEFLAHVHSIVKALIYAENFFIALYDESNKTWSLAYYVDTVDTTDISTMQNIPLNDLRKTMTGYVLRTGQMLFADSAKQEELGKAGEIESVGADSVEWLGLPLKVGQNHLGVMVVQSYDTAFHYSRNDISLLQFVSRHIANAVMRKQEDEKIQNLNKELEERVKLRTVELQEALSQLKDEYARRQESQHIQSACYEIALQGQKQQTLYNFCESVHKIIATLIKATDFYIALYDHQTGALSFPYIVDKFMQDHTTVMIAPDELARSPLLTAKVLKDRETKIFTKEEIMSNRPELKDSTTLPNIWMGVPLRRNEKTIGAVVLQNHDDETSYSLADKDLMEFVASHLSAAVQRRMDAESLSIAHERLQESNEQLEERIKNRTHELEQLLAQRDEIAARLIHDATHDSLTGLPNRSLLLERLNNTIQRFKRKKNLAFAIFFLDLDRFKVINDSLGHLYGDRLLIEVAIRLTNSVRPGDTVARLGGDEFCVLLDDINEADEVQRIARRILSAISTSFILDEHKIYTSTSIGITTNENRYKDAETAIRDADAAMYRAKAEGKNRYAFYNEALLKDALDRLRLETDLRQAIEDKKLIVHYQPLYSLKTGELVGFEALSRWRHEQRGMVAPYQFIPIAEETNLIGTLTDQVIENVAVSVKEWHAHFGEIFPVNVNLSAKQISDETILNYLQQISQQYAIPPESIKMEITETLLINNFNEAQSLLGKLSQAGFSILLDDFGTGYSSLNYLHQFPITSIKIDRSFIAEATSSEKAMRLLVGIKEIAKNLNLSLVAEGIETINQLKLLRGLDIEFGQGYLFGAPMDKVDAERLIAKKCHPVFATLDEDQKSIR